ncbi:beta-N-acetylhexosaminidase [Roseibium sediminicola]|uniref:beta-N-acetylhexosaminidase n=1 Tax=Roseibium sediminicola TaxID=2933272 RepID=A0ABT0GQ70_9HYPH|nr:beta-N-acetylhexosaminidase [Roseibium sp. CAU 1639]MCK7611573.1 beta-N-acetylhexosaminidase [Roseibium sp. CAU 1639]
MSQFILDSYFHPSDDLNTARLDLVLTNTSSKALAAFTLAYTSVVRARAEARLQNAEAFTRIANFHEITPPENLVLQPGEAWRFSVEGLTNQARHRLDGPKSAYLTTAGRIIDVQCTDLAAPKDLDSGERRSVPEGEIGEPLYIVPWPQTVSASTYAKDVTAFLVSTGETEDKAAAAKINALSKRLFSNAPAPFRFTETSGLMALSFLADNELPEVGYRLSFASGAVTLAHGGRTGRDYGLTVLAQLAYGTYRAPETYRIPSDGVIEDAPRFSWRGTHLDVSRHFRGPKDILRLLDILAWARMNVFQWHLTDDEGWRLEIKAYPELTVSGAKRGPGCQQVAQLGYASEVYQGAYSQDDVREVVAHATSLNIDVLPEIDVPGHSWAVLKTYPYLADQAETPESYHSVQGYPNNALNPAMDETYIFLEKVFAEVASLFPFNYVHIGGDEVDTKAWLASPKTQRLMEELGLKDTMEVQAYFMGCVREILKKFDKNLAGWDEVSHGGGIDPDGVLLMAWQKPEVTRDLIQQGYDVICTPGQYYYLDMAQASGWQEPGASWAGVSSPEDAYGYEATDGLSDESEGTLKGVQACIWCEHMIDNTIFNHMVFPRLYAIAEAGWTEPQNKDWQRFAARSRLFPSL